jgi:thiosulfate/3-mercaptopyruvate sulfurtransferase
MSPINGYTQIISAADLQARLSLPDWVVVDCRFDLSQPDWGFSDYLRGHIQGAVYAHLDYDLSGPRTPVTGRHPLPDPQAFRETMGRLGIDRSKQVIVYDTAGGSIAVRLVWLLKYYGHERVAVLDGGYLEWRNHLFPTEYGSHSNPSATFTGAPDPRMIVTTGEMLTLSAQKKIQMIDARAPERYRGEREPIDPVAGRIPGAVNRFYGLNLNRDGLFLPPDQLKSEFLELLGGTSPEKAVVYCGSGVTSPHHLLAMTLAGLPMARLYAGSWSEWIQDPDRPIERG